MRLGSQGKNSRQFDHPPKIVYQVEQSVTPGKLNDYQAC